ncbi:IclR family transcriptional regulator [Streptomyces cavernicola]|uniref:Helix-turn-helix domain-containing protein n=1 Tax=Streptomyces cavernicola TaxID=3043613 RepID=A0ABT6S5J9_9ACTN|nr:helix-turn-helix domain-containing protein [Streptomyces sp. B-S-A6]MDI3403348.1 helix-turn-helix domain-containing protein [Streptomyces sp. B-S-A6]
MSDERAAASPAGGDTSKGQTRQGGAAGKGASGSQTLARGLQALEAIAGRPQGLTVQDVAQHLGVHRTIAYRILVTLTDFRLAVRTSDGRYRAGSGMVTLARGYAAGIREAALPILRRTADELGATVALIAAEGDEQVAVAVVEPRTVDYHLGYRVGSRHPLGIGAAGLALSSLRLPSPGEPADAAEVRERGYARTFGEIEPGAYGVAVPLHTADPGLHLCVNLITTRKDVADGAVPTMLRVAEEISTLG